MDILDKFKGEILSKISQKFAVEKYDIGSYKRFNYPKYMPLARYNVDQYKVHNMGNLAILQCRTVGVMKVLTAIITPDLSTNIPFIIIDFIKINKRWIMFFEFFDEHTNKDQYIEEFKEKIFAIRDKYNFLENYNENPQWYVEKRAKYSILKCGKKNQLENVESLLKEVLWQLSVFIEKADAPTNITASRVIVDIFREDLINKGSPASEPICKALGKHEGRAFFEDVAFYLED